jgi:secreted trypsin-like serine protease
MSVKRSVPRALAALLALAAGCTSTIEPAVFSRRIVGGTETSGDPAIVLLIAQKPGSQLATLCTATIISPHVLLTAAHCVSAAAIGEGMQFSVYLGASIDNARPADLLPVKAVHAHPDFSLSDVLAGGDIGVAVTEAALSPTPVPMNRQALSKDLVGEPARMVGYGKTTADDTTGATAGQKREVATVMGSFTEKLVRFGRAGETTCEGDSGGPGLMTLEGREVVVGVVSFGDQSCAELGVDTRVDVYADDFVQPFIDEIDPGTGGGGGGGGDKGCAMAGSGALDAAALACVLALVGLRRLTNSRRSSRRGRRTA